MILVTVDRISIASISVLVIVLFCFSLSRDAVSHGYQQSKNTLQGHGIIKRNAAVYAGRQFHEEVTSSISCLLYDMGFSVTVYYYAEMVVGGFSIPLADNRLTNSKSHFGRCVDHWVSITPFTTLVYNFKILVFVSYPMKMDHHTVDAAAHNLIKQIRTRKLNTKLILITHQAKENIWKHLNTFDQYISRDRIIFMFLSQHTYETALQLQKQMGLTYNMSYIYPTVPLRLLFGEDKSAEFGLQRTNSANSSKHINFAIQGHFGGVHTKRRNVTATLTCLHSIARHTDMQQHSALTKTDTENISVPKVQLKLIGRTSGDLNLVAPLNSSIQVTITGELTPVEFCKKIAAAHYLVTSLGSDLYLHRQATSTIPTALVLHVPIVTSTQVLRLYPCLWVAPIHRQFTQDTECDTMQHVMQLNEEDYMRAKEEVANCSEVLWSKAKKTMESILE